MIGFDDDEMRDGVDLMANAEELLLLQNHHVKNCNYSEHKSNLSL
jgi:hypothetical protein